jgi:hypothetical protein
MSDKHVTRRNRVARTAGIVVVESEPESELIKSYRRPSSELPLDAEPISSRPQRTRPERPAPASTSSSVGRFAWEPTEPHEPEHFDYDADLSIDLNFLHLECEKHPKLFMKYSKEASRAKRAASWAEEKVKTLRSQLVKEANTNPDMYLGKGIKPTAPIVEAYYRDHPDYCNAKREWIEAVYYADLMSGTVFAFQARKLSLENEVKLHGQQYYSVPAIENLSEAAKQFNDLKERNIETRIRERLNHRKEG